MGEGLKVINVKSTKISSLQWPVRCVSTKYGPCEIMDGFCATFIVCALIIWLGEKKMFALQILHPADCKYVKLASWKSPAKVKQNVSH